MGFCTPHLLGAHADWAASLQILSFHPSCEGALITFPTLWPNLSWSQGLSRAFAYMQHSGLTCCCLGHELKSSEVLHCILKRHYRGRPFLMSPHMLFLCLRTDQSILVNLWTFLEGWKLKNLPLNCEVGCEICLIMNGATESQIQGFCLWLVILSER